MKTKLWWLKLRLNILRISKSHFTLGFMLKIADLQAHSASHCDALWACRSAIFSKCKISRYDSIKARQNIFQSTKSTVDLVDKNYSILFQTWRSIKWNSILFQTWKSIKWNSILFHTFHTCVGTLLTSGVGNWRPGGQMRPSPSLNAARRLISEYWYSIDSSCYDSKLALITSTRIKNHYST